MSIEEDLATADRIVARAMAGVVPQRLFSADEEMAFVRAYVAMRTMAQAAVDAASDGVSVNSSGHR